MTGERLFLLAVGTFSVLAGIAYLVAPVELAAATQTTLESSTAVIEVRGFYGGQMIGLGIFMLLGLQRAEFTRPALVLAAASLGGTGAGRVVGMVADGVAPGIMLALLGVELGCAAVALWLARR